MSHEELELTIRKARKLKELRRAKERVKRLEQELRGAPVQPEDPPYVPEFLRVQRGAEWTERATSHLPCLPNDKETHARTAAEPFGRNMPSSQPPTLPQRSRLPETLHGRSRHLVDLLPEPSP
jgi:hypothetical protein